MGKLASSTMRVVRIRNAKAIGSNPWLERLDAFV
jgi:hypothetical protein